ncbi:YppD family protein [Bacillus sp. HSf4]|uniref:YppD family protein n=1 Tax=Bacillus sp. HSf4 TaxID=3035514 RepID=UPI002409FBB2|nr:YppD family protein [Bacillus sp. HSf4]WFA03446.1 YppD family protein [Bacillus sp. HSf4]
MSGFVSKDSVLQMLLDTETELESAETALTDAVTREKDEKSKAWNERLDLIEKELTELSSCLNSTLMGVKPHEESA